MTPFEEAERKRKEKFAVLMQVFPGDVRLANALAMTEGVCDQLTALNDSLRTDVRQFYGIVKPGTDTAEGEERLMQTVADVLAWATQLEFSLHDLRKTLFFRFNLRIKKPGETIVVVDPPMQGQPGWKPPPGRTAPILQEPAVPRPTPEPLDEFKQGQVADKLQGLFDEVTS